MTRRKISAKENKTITVYHDRMSVIYTDTNKHYTYMFDNQSPTKDVTLFGKVYKGHKAQDAKDYLNPRQRRILNDILYSKGRYTEEQLKKMPLMRQYYILDVARKVEAALYKWKWEMVNGRVDDILTALFPHSKTIKKFINICQEKHLGADVSRIDIRTLVSEQEIVEYLQLKGLFPKQ